MQAFFMSPISNSDKCSIERRNIYPLASVLQTRQVLIPDPIFEWLLRMAGITSGCKRRSVLDDDIMSRLCVRHHAPSMSNDMITGPAQILAAAVH